VEANMAVRLVLIEYELEDSSDDQCEIVQPPSSDKRTEK